MILNATTASRVTQRYKDHMGRWVGLLLKGREGQQLFILQFYQVAQHSQAGEWTAFSQQRSILRQQGKKSSPREAFTMDLKTLLTTMRQTNPNLAILIMGDANDNILRTTSKFGGLMDSLNLFDIHRYHHYPAAPPETYLRGSTQIDYMYASSNLLPYIHNCGMTSYHSFVDSDHRGLWIDVYLSKFLGNNPMIAPNIASRTINSSDRKQVQDYRTHLLRYWRDHNISQRTSTLTQLLEDYSLRPTSEARSTIINHAEKLDSDIAKGQLHAEAKSKPRYKTPWSPKLIAARHRLLWWKLRLSQRLTGRDLTKYFSRDMKRRSLAKSLPFQPPKLLYDAKSDKRPKTTD